MEVSIRAAFQFSARVGSTDALYVVLSALVATNRTRIITFALSARLPTSFNTREYVEAGALMSYGPNFPTHPVGEREQCYRGFVLSIYRHPRDLVVASLVNRLFPYEPKEEGNQKEREVNEAAYSQEFGRHRKSKKRDTDLIPPKIPARASRYKKRTGEKLTDLFPINAHNPTFPR